MSPAVIMGTIVLLWLFGRSRFNLARYFERALKLTNARLTSAYRSERVNAIVHGHKNSRHMRGLAIDLVSPLGHKEAGRVLQAAADAGELGPLKRVLVEGDHVHLSFEAPQ